MGSGAKISIALKSDAPCRAVQTPREFWYAYNSATQSGGIGRRVVTGAAGAAENASRLGFADGGATWKARIKEIRPDLDLTDEYVFTNWTEESHTGGTYTMPGLSWRPEHVAAFDQPLGKIAFAGEHTLFPSLNGALITGERAARLVAPPAA